MANLAVGALALLLFSLIIGDELAKLTRAGASPTMSLARSSPGLPAKDVDFTPTGAIGRPPCGEKVE